MAGGKELKPRAFSLDPRFSYLAKEDRYLFAKEEPKYKFNVIGCGLNGNEHIHVTLLEGRATIHGVFDKNPGSIELAKRSFASFSTGQELVIYDSLESACNDPAADALIIATPNYTHLEVLQVAIQSGKHIFLEKPMATTLEDAHQILQLAREYPATLQIGLQYRYKSMYTEAIHEAFERKSLGEIKMVNIVEHRFPFLDKVNQWNKFSKYSGGTLVEKCCHYFDLLNMFAQAKPVSVFATGNMAVNFKDFEYDGEKSDIIDNAVVSVVYENGIRGSFNLCMFAPMFYEEITLCGDEGYLKAYEIEDFLPVPRPKIYLEVLRGEAQPSRFCNPCYPPYIEESGHNGATFYEHVNFIDNIEGKPTNAATVEEGFWSVVVGVAAEQSVRTGKVVLIDELLK
ncbi:MAG: Gfo/Idh/MocA family oxidoreductase [Anaerolineales bacterium]|nr:Gfo/Idh/MocA family oxidoreductase [Chloroflexota bacterium]MBL7162574.1 Gfo/Idh/MocA family oxidoreductase [Anaerolineales bacterium]